MSSKSASHVTLLGLLSRRGNRRRICDRTAARQAEIAIPEALGDLVQRHGDGIGRSFGSIRFSRRWFIPIRRRPVAGCFCLRSFSIAECCNRLPIETLPIRLDPIRVGAIVRLDICRLTRKVLAGVGIGSYRELGNRRER